MAGGLVAAAALGQLRSASHSRSGLNRLALVSRGASAYSYFDDSFACMAHRGGYLQPADAGRENSLYAFTRAVEAGYRYLETDVHATRDGRLVAFHDDVLDRVTDASGVVADLPFEAVREARIDGQDQVPTLDEVLEAFPGVRLNIDIKAPGAIQPLVATIRAHNAAARVCVASFSGARLRRFRHLMGDRVATGLTGRSVAWGAYMPLLRHLPLPGQVFQVPLRQQVAGREVPVLTGRLIAAARAHDLRVHVWTINDADQMRQLIDLGVDGLIADRIDLLREVAIERGLWTD